ncbi:calcium-translocating P-type ATPase, SERCA-type family protein [Cryptosporidium muris RN66]|uniref:P-type Ca(2+) transporter n=1 Tax=Cryptosporidium muris (strain RN66) TaxID=441375 RepID=B6AEY9_CRYMR|nr:calcium-translocating P-type ATPase, SERCA-type family protein [Cryptosporidium muris RN66]EEA06756.1 calcium-translocating P-type ATPase, SERCA-type family protein [Cryptosporidium muris RN66]|eukprot:XP_002141105.1 calcium-translocating P-type ATPase, SERCA-type family protein [Cryptosporidium muris RN66]
MISLPEDPHIRTYDEILRHFNVDVDVGLSLGQIDQYTKYFGRNALDEQEKISIWNLILAQFNDLLVKILLGAALMSFIFATMGNNHMEEGISSFIEPIVILCILIINAFVGVWQESNAENALEALKRLQPELAEVLRCGIWSEIPAEELVPGDIVRVRVGDRIPADLRIIKLLTTSLRVEQSQLTGESSGVLKTADSLDMSKRYIEIQAKNNMLYSSTTIVHGSCVACVVSTGMKTEIGAIQSAVQKAAENTEDTPLSKKVNEFGEMLSKVIAVICIIVWVINCRNFKDPAHGSVINGAIYYFKIAVALAVAAIPEGLPAVITTCLALGTRKMAQRNAIVRRLPSVETLGCTTVICSDKTGTLTTSEMCCVRFFIPKNSMEVSKYSVEGHSYSPIGNIYKFESSNSSIRFKHITAQDASLQWLAKCLSLCNASQLTVDNGCKFKIQGEPTEGALRVLVEKLGCTDEKLNKRYLNELGARASHTANIFSNFWCEGVKLITTLEFHRDRKSMSVLCRDTEDTTTHIPIKTYISNNLISSSKSFSKSNILYVKGAPESILERCTTFMMPDGTVETITEDYKNIILEEVGNMANDALRTLAAAIRFDGLGPLSEYLGQAKFQGAELLSDPSRFVEIEQQLCFLGVVGIFDPPRPGVKNAILRCQKAGIRVFMITGDNRNTAEAIASSIGILQGSKYSWNVSHLAEYDNQEKSSMLKPLMIEESDEKKSRDVSNGRFNFMRLNSEPFNSQFTRCCSLTGREFEELPDNIKLSILRESFGVVFSRTEPKHKQVIVKLLSELGEITAMTGDGVNDAPALKQADIGISMGITGTDVAKEASDMILADDNFETIVAAIEQGRSIYMNMKAFIRYLISSNIGEVASIFLTAALGIPEGLAPVQLLWVNLVTDGFPATALGFNPPDPRVMRRPPRRKDDSLISAWVFIRFLIIGLYVGIATVGIFIWWYVWGIDPTDGNTLVTFEQLRSWAKCNTWQNFISNPVYGSTISEPCSYFTTGKKKASTLSLTVLVVIEMLNALNALSEDNSLLQVPPWANPLLFIAIILSIMVHLVILYIPPIAAIFNVVPLSFTDWKAVIWCSIPVIIIDEILKAISRGYHRVIDFQMDNVNDLDVSKSHSPVKKIQ